MNKTLDFYYFSGTGNTHAFVNYVVKTLEQHGHRVSLKLIERGYVSNPSTNDLWLAFPINSQSVSPFIWKFFKSLPDSKGTKVYVIATLNNSAHLLEPLYTLLKNKGYVPASACEISMPNNMTDSDYSKDNDQRILTAAYEKADHFVRNTMTGDFTWKSEYKGSPFVSFLSRKTALPWMSMRLMLKLRTIPEKCIECGLCAKQCPAGNITVVNQLPVHGNKCEFCMKCADYCPKRAIQVSGKKKIHFRNARMHNLLLNNRMEILNRSKQ